MTIKQLKQKIENIPDDSNVLINIDVYNSNGTWDSQALNYETYVIDNFAVTDDGDSVSFSPYDSITV